MKLKQFLLTTVSLLFLCFYSNSFATNDSLQRVGRYLTVDAKPLSAQRDLLSQIIQVHFPVSVQSINDAMQYLLRFSGYSLVPANQMNSAFKITLSKPLPAIDRHFGPMSLKDALVTLAGPAFTLVHDPINRTVNFQLKPNFKKRIHRHYTH